MTPLEFDPLTLLRMSLHMREVLNGALFALSMNLAVMLFYLMACMWKLHGRGWSKVGGMPTTCILAWVFFIVGWRSGLVWISLRFANDGTKLSATVETLASWSLLLSAAAFAILTLRATHLWSPVKGHHRAWMLSAAITATFLLISEYL